MEKDELLTRYRAIRRLIGQWQAVALDTVPTSAVREQAKRLGLLVEGMSIVASATERNLVVDLAIHTAKEGRSRAIDRIAKRATEGEDMLASQVLDGLRAARFTGLLVGEPHEAAGVWVEDVYRRTRLWLLDEMLAQTAPPGILMAGRFAPMGEFWVGCSAAVQIDETTIEAIRRRGFGVRARDLDAVLSDRRFAEAIFQIGTSCFIRSMSAPQKASAAPRCLASTRT